VIHDILVHPLHTYTKSSLVRGEKDKEEQNTPIDLKKRGVSAQGGGGSRNSAKKDNKT